MPTEADQQGDPEPDHERFEQLFGRYVRPVMWIEGDTRHIDYPWYQCWINKDVPTFYFWISMTRNLLGRDWLGIEGGPPVSPQHLIHKWRNQATAQWMTDREKAKSAGGVRQDGTFDSEPWRETQAVVRLGYEAFVLTACNVELGDLPNDLRDPDRFLSSRFELAVGAFLSIAGLSVEFLRRGKVKTPDIKAFDRLLGKHLHVEVKRKNRTKEGAATPISSDGNWQLNIRHRLKDALLQLEHYVRPWIACIDLDLDFPMPSENDVEGRRRFLDAIVMEWEEAIQLAKREQPGIPTSAPDMLLIVQVPYNNDGAYDADRKYRFLPAAHNSSPFAADFPNFALRLKLAESQFNRIPHSWDHLGPCTVGPNG